MRRYLNGYVPSKPNLRGRRGRWMRLGFHMNPRLDEPSDSSDERRLDAI